MAKKNDDKKQPELEQAVLPETADQVAQAEAPKAAEAPAPEEEKLDPAAEKAYQLLCKQLGMDPDEIEAMAKAKAKQREREATLVDYNLGGTEVRINGVVYPNEGRAPAPVVEQLVHAAGAKKMRILRESIRHEWQIEQLAGGGFSTKLVKKSAG